MSPRSFLGLARPDPDRLRRVGGRSTPPPPRAHPTLRKTPNRPSPPNSKIDPAKVVEPVKSEVKGGGQEPQEKVTPNQKIDPKKVVEPVKSEVKGGEAASPSRTDHMFAYPDLTLIKDEPLEVDPPRGLQPLMANVYVPASNPLTKGKYELGKQLYFDPRISKNTTVSCATCHNPEKGWTDNLKTSVGIFGQVGGRNAPTVLNTSYGKTMFWDGRAPSLEGQSQGPPQNPIEMGNQSYEEIVDRLRTIPGYVEQFKKVFGTDVNLDGIAKAIATFERVDALSGASAYDKYQDSDNPDHNKLLTESQKRGMVLFGLALNADDEFKTDIPKGKASCTKCHAGFNFSDEQFHNLGVGLGREIEAVQGPRPLGRDGGRFQEPGGTRFLQDPDLSGHREDGPLHARRERADSGGRDRILRSGRQSQRHARQGHQAPEAHEGREGRPRELHESPDPARPRRSSSPPSLPGRTGSRRTRGLPWSRRRSPPPCNSRG